jgi:GT2 family glycosyltransferase
VDADPTLAAVTPRLVYPDGSAQSLGGRVDWETGSLLSLPPGSLPRPTPVGWYVTGAAMLLRADVLREVGGFDQRFFAYWEEFDLCTRILRHGGWNLGVVGGAECVHLERASSGVASPFVTHLMCRNAWLFVRKHRPVTAWPRLWLRFAAVQLVHAASLNAGGHPAQAAAVLSALWAGLTNRFHKPRRVVAPGNVSAFVLGHFWGVARRFWGVANWLSPDGMRRPPLGAHGTRPVGGAA